MTALIRVPKRTVPIGGVCINTLTHTRVCVYIYTHVCIDTHSCIFMYVCTCVFDFHLSIYLEICFKELTHGSHDYRGLVKTISDRIGLQIGDSGKKM